MIDWWAFVQQDLTVIFTGLDSRDWLYPLSCILMLVIFWLPLHGIDRRDQICGLLYIVYIIAAGTVLFFAVPGVEKGMAAMGLHLAFISLLGSAAAYRWFHTNDALVVVAKAQSKKAAEETQREMQSEEV